MRFGWWVVLKGDVRLDSVNVYVYMWEQIVFLVICVCAGWLAVFMCLCVASGVGCSVVNVF